jgi:hypothetical protein
MAEFIVTAVFRVEAESGVDAITALGGALDRALLRVLDAEGRVSYHSLLGMLESDDPSPLLGWNISRAFAAPEEREVT